MKKIKWRIVIICCLIFISSIFATTYFNYKTMSNILNEKTLYSMKQVSDKYSIELESWLGSQVSMFNQVYEDIVYDKIYDNQGLISFFKHKNKTNQEIEEYYMALDKNALVTENEVWLAKDGYDVKDRDWYVNAKESGLLEISEPYKDVHHGKLIITLSKRVDNEGKFIGVLCCDITIDYLINLINKSRPSIEGYGFLVDENKNILAHPNIDFLYNKDDGLTNLNDIYDVEKYENGKIKGNINIVSDYDNEDKYFLYEDLNYLGLSIGLLIPVKEAMAPISDLLKNSMMLTMIIGLFTIILTISFGESISSPIVLASGYIEEISKLNLNINIDKKLYSRDDEIGSMYKSFQTIINTLRIFFNRFKNISYEIDSISKNMLRLSIESNRDVENILADIMNIIEINSSQESNISNCIEDLQQVIIGNINSQEISNVLNQLYKEDEMNRFRNEILSKTLEFSNKQRLQIQDIYMISEKLDDISSDLLDTINQFKF